MTPSIVAIGTAVPPTRLTQGAVRDLMVAQHPDNRLTRRLIAAAFDAAAIDARHSALAGLLSDAPADTLPIRDGDRILDPTTSERNAEFRRLAPALFAEAARAALSNAAIPADRVTHVITVSCTGLFAPGPDVALVRDLGLATSVERYHHGFVGCAAAIPALRAAHRIVLAQPGSVVLVVTAELCSLHIRVSDDPEQIVAASVFGDGAAAAIVTDTGGGMRLELDDFATALTDDGERDMAWTIGDHGFEMTLTAEVPRIVGREVRGAVGPLLGSDAWAVHPGGRSVLDRVADALELTDAEMAPSRAVLREYGNMSSATIMFILRALLHDDALPDGATIAALAFGPGLSVESARMRRRTA